MKIGGEAPDFTAKDQNGRQLRLKDCTGKWIVLYFYPRADTPDCTIEACSFRDAFGRFRGLDAVVLGVSPDEPEVQKNFSQKYELPFTLLSDPDRKICNAFGVIQEENIASKKIVYITRTTFIIAPDGRVRSVFREVRPERHAEHVLQYLTAEQKRAS
jgi:thioredoxin-dependent peroxiredoxin